MFGLGAPEILLIAVVVLAMFGYKKLPDAARALGRSMRIFKAETRGMRQDDVQAKAEAEAVRGELITPQPVQSTAEKQKQPETASPARPPQAARSDNQSQQG